MIMSERRQALADTPACHSRKLNIYFLHVFLPMRCARKFVKEAPSARSALSLVGNLNWWVCERNEKQGGPQATV